MISSVLTSTILACLLFAQQDEDPTRWESTIEAFEAAEAESPVPENAILFVGSSSIKGWDLDSSFTDFPVVNRGFGGSQTSDMNHYLDRLVLKHRPKIVVVYEGDNDINNGKSAPQVVADFEYFFERMEEELPSTHVIYIPIKPSLARWTLWPEMEKANDGVRKIINRNASWHYVDVAAPMIGEDGTPMSDLFIDDGLHLNPKGYELWTSLVRAEIEHALDSVEMQSATGIVFHDKNNDGRFGSLDSTLEGIRVSNGRDIVETDAQGRYTIPVDDDDIIFVLKPRGWRTPLTKEMIPHFYYIHKPNGSPDSRFEGVAATGDLPESIDFPLYPQTEPERFEAIMFGDPQPRNQREVEFVTRDVVQELVGTEAAFGVTLGDITFDNLDLFETQNQAIALLGIPWYNVIGNHDVNREASTDELSDESFERVYGPSYYSFDYGPTHFVVIDNIEWYVDEANGQRKYRAGLGEQQLRFLREDLARISDDQLVVLMMHIPIVGMRDREKLYRLIEDRPFCMSISGHTHHHEHRFLTREDGWRGIEPHHHVINVTVSGSWWGGAPDERGIPHAMMADGAPNGYSIIRFDGVQYRVDFKAAGRPSDYQMKIITPNQVATSEVGDVTVYANVFNGSERSKVEMRIDGHSDWADMTHSREVDPQFKELSQNENGVANKSWRDLPGPKVSPHLWKLALPESLEPGVHLIEVRATDEHGQSYTSGRAIRVVE